MEVEDGAVVAPLGVEVVHDDDQGVLAREDVAVQGRIDGDEATDVLKSVMECCYRAVWGHSIVGDVHNRIEMHTEQQMRQLHHFGCVIGSQDRTESVSH